MTTHSDTDTDLLQMGMHNAICALMAIELKSAAVRIGLIFIVTAHVIPLPPVVGTGWNCTESCLVANWLLYQGLISFSFHCLVA